MRNANSPCISKNGCAWSRSTKDTDYNLMCPVFHLSRPNIVVEKMMLEVITSVEAHIKTLRQASR